jgi:hypothetical protein
MIAKALGHSTTAMAERYARPSEDALREAVTDALDSTVGAGPVEEARGGQNDTEQ